MNNTTTNRRAFLAAGAVAIPTIALAKGIGLRGSAADDSQFDDYMKQARDHLKSMRGAMRSLDDPAQRNDAAFLANQISVMMTKCIEVADEVSIPERDQAQYADNPGQFYTDLRIGLTKAATASVALTRALLQGDAEEARQQFNALREANKRGHEKFKEDD